MSEDTRPTHHIGQRVWIPALVIRVSSPPEAEGAAADDPVWVCLHSHESAAKLSSVPLILRVRAGALHERSAVFFDEARDEVVH